MEKKREFMRMIEILNELAISAGQAIKKIHQEDLDLGVQYKDDESPLTKADLKSNQIITEGLRKHFPEIPILSEEGEDIHFSDRKDWSQFFLIDPLDGTKEFIKKRNNFTVNIALIENNKPKLGVVYAPMFDKLFFGDIHESFLREEGNTHKLPMREFNNEKLIVVGSQSHMNDETKAYIEELQKNHPNMEFRQSGSSLKICLIAEGTADFYPRLGPTCEWDTGAAHAIVKGAGGDILDFHSKEPLRYNKEDIYNPHFLVKRAEVTQI